MRNNPISGMVKILKFTDIEGGCWVLYRAGNKLFDRNGFGEGEKIFAWRKVGGYSAKNGKRIAQV